MPLHKKIFLFLLFLSIGLSAQITDTLITKRTFFLSDNKKQTPLDSLVDKAVLGFIQSPENCGISIGFTKNDTSYFYNYGETKRDSKILPSAATSYELGSVTVTFCGILLAQAVTENRLRLEDDIRKYLPGIYPQLTFNKKAILIKHLANHTSGLSQIPEDMLTQPDFDSLNPYKNYTTQKIYSYLRSIQLTSEPGTAYDYSNLGVAVLGLILEKVYGQSFDELVKEKICQPNNMTNTGVTLHAIHQSASGYNQDGVPMPAWDLGAFAAAGGLKSSGADMLAYLSYNLKEKDKAVRLAHMQTFKDRQALGLCWFINKTKYGNTLTWHNGATYGFSSFCGFVKEKNCSVVILSNTATSVDYIGIAILNYLQQ